MVKEIIPSKMVITLDDKGEFSEGVLLYKVKVDGVLYISQRSIAIKNMAFSKLNLAKIIKITIDKTKEQEGISVEDT